MAMHSPTVPPSPDWAAPMLCDDCGRHCQDTATLAAHTFSTSASTSSSASPSASSLASALSPALPPGLGAESWCRPNGVACGVAPGVALKCGHLVRLLRCAGVHDLARRCAASPPAWPPPPVRRPSCDSRRPALTDSAVAQAVVPRRRRLDANAASTPSSNGIMPMNLGWDGIGRTRLRAGKWKSAPRRGSPSVEVLGDANHVDVRNPSLRGSRARPRGGRRRRCSALVQALVAQEVKARRRP